MTWLAGKVRNSWLTSSYITTHLPNTYVVMYDESSLLDHATNRDRLLTYNLHLLDYYGVAIHQLRYTLIAKVKMSWAIATRNIIIFTLSQTAVLGHAVKTTPPTHTHTGKQSKSACTPRFSAQTLSISLLVHHEKKRSPFRTSYIMYVVDPKKMIKYVAECDQFTCGRAFWLLSLAPFGR